MTLSLPMEKIDKIRKECRHTLNHQDVTGRQLAHIIGLMTSILPAVLPAPLHYRALQRLRVEALGRKKFPDYDKPVKLSLEAVEDLQWWINSLKDHNGRAIYPPEPSLVLESDASKKGWGAHCRESGVATGGPWTLKESQAHINWLELKAALLAIQSFGNHPNCHIQMFLDSQVAIAYINQMGGTHSLRLCKLAKEFWKWCLEHQVTVHAEHLPGRLNRVADFESRHLSDCSDWRLSPKVFSQLNYLFGPFSIDLFASHLNTQTTRFYSWRPDPQAIAVDALAHPWNRERPYAFPPFTLIGAQRAVRVTVIDSADLASRNMVPPFAVNAQQQSSDPAILPGPTTESSAGTTPPDPEPSPCSSRVAHIQNTLTNQGISQESTDIIRKSWRKGTAKSYDSAWRRWVSWCDQRSVDPFSTSLADIVQFLTDLHVEGKEYSTVNTYRSAISMSHVSVEGVVFGKHPTVCRLMQGIFNSRPPKPKYKSVWDVDVVVTYIRSMEPSEQLSIKDLS